MAKTKTQISFAVTAKLICVFVFAYAKNRFSHDAAQFEVYTPYMFVRIVSFVSRLFVHHVLVFCIGPPLAFNAASILSCIESYSSAALPFSYLLNTTQRMRVVRQSSLLLC